MSKEFTNTNAVSEQLTNAVQAIFRDRGQNDPENDIGRYEIWGSIELFEPDAESDVFQMYVESVSYTAAQLESYNVTQAQFIKLVEAYGSIYTLEDGEDVTDLLKNQLK